MVKKMEISKENYRAMILFCFKDGLPRQKCAEKLHQYFGEGAPSLSTVQRWYNEFARERVSLKDEFHEGRPVTAVTPENIATVRQMIRENPRITYDDIEAALNISRTRVEKILHEHLGVTKRCARWIPHNLTVDQKAARVEWCNKMLQKFNNGLSKHVYDIVTGDETWIYCYEPERKQQSTVWVFPGEAAPTKLKRGRSVGKQMIASFFSLTGHIATVALPLDSTVTAYWYTTQCLRTVLIKVREKRPRGEIMLHHDNASSHTAGLTTDYLKANGVELLNPPTYSPDLAPCDFFLFPRIKDKMRGLRFNNAAAAVEAYEQLISEVPSDRWEHCFKEWFDRMNKCIKCHGDYLEKQ